LKGKKVDLRGENDIFIDSGICLQLTSRKSEENSKDIFKKNVKFWFYPTTFDPLQLH
jgi:hypothetical protein